MGVADDADGQGSDYVEADNTPEDHLADARDGVSRVLDFSCSEGGQIWTGEREGSVDHHAEETEKATGRAISVVFVHHTVGPVAEAVGVVFRVAAHHGDERKKHKPDNQEDFGRGHDEFALSVPFHGDDV